MHISLICRGLVTALLIGTLPGGAIVAATLDVPFDFSRRAIGIDVTVHGVPLYMGRYGTNSEVLPDCA